AWMPALVSALRRRCTPNHQKLPARAASVVAMARIRGGRPDIQRNSRSGDGVQEHNAKRRRARLNRARHRLGKGSASPKPKGEGANDSVAAGGRLKGIRPV